MQQSLTMWHGLLQATGGELVPEKCVLVSDQFHLDQQTMEI